MKNVLLIILIFVVGGINAQNNDCNFTMNIQGSIVQDSTYSLKSFSFTGVKASHHSKIFTLIDFDNDQMVTLNVEFFQEFLRAVCQ